VQAKQVLDLLEPSPLNYTIAPRGMPHCTSSEQLSQRAAINKRGMSHRIEVQATAC
jgi:hypothetical protein